MYEVMLDSKVKDANLDHFISQLGCANSEAEICVDFGKLGFIEPGAVVALLAKTHRWLQDGRSVTFRRIEECQARQYLQRMDFFAHCGLTFTDDFNSRPSSGRFVEIKRLKSRAEVERLATSLATCVAPELAELTDPNETGLFDCVEYALSELALNVTQHSRSDGFAMAQFYPKTSQVYLAIADFGIGIKESFIANGSPLVSPESTELDAIQKALEPKVSSKIHQKTPWGDPVNAGVGLTLLNALSAGMGGTFKIVSGSGVYERGIGKVLSENCRFNGTVCAMSFSRGSVIDFATMLTRAKTDAGLLKSQDGFSELFQ